jgi:hypothetical protein
MHQVLLKQRAQSHLCRYRTRKIQQQGNVTEKVINHIGMTGTEMESEGKMDGKLQESTGVGTCNK